MGHGGDENDEESLGPNGPRHALPDPLDRVWMHPSELSPLVAAPKPAPNRDRPLWIPTLVAGAAGAILTLGVLGMTGTIGGSSDSAGEKQTVTTTASVFAAPTVAVAVGRSVVAVSVRDSSGTRRGSGVAVRRTKEILTSYRLVGTATDVSVTAADGTVHTAHIVGRDQTTDLVLLRLNSGVPAATAATRAPRAGETVSVVSAAKAGAKSPWMSSGPVSNADSIVAVADGPTTSGLIEAETKSNAASSGGALVDSAGNVAGIVLAPVGDGNMTYAVPIATALAIAADLRTDGYATHGALGVALADAPAGPTVAKLVDDGPAERAGIEVGDVVERVEGREVDSMQEVMALVRHDEPGEPIVVELSRGTRKLTMKPTLTSITIPD